MCTEGRTNIIDSLSSNSDSDDKPMSDHRPSHPVTPIPSSEPAANMYGVGNEEVGSVTTTVSGKLAKPPVLGYTSGCMSGRHHTHTSEMKAT
jgi:hypothetical protein